MPSRVGEPPRKSWRSYAAFWMSMRGEPDENLGARNLSRITASAWLDAASLCMARCSARRPVRRGEHDVPSHADALRSLCDDADANDGGAGGHIHGTFEAKGSGR